MHPLGRWNMPLQQSPCQWYNPIRRHCWLFSSNSYQSPIIDEFSKFSIINTKSNDFVSQQTFSEQSHTIMMAVFPSLIQNLHNHYFKRRTFPTPTADRHRITTYNQSIHLIITTYSFQIQPTNTCDWSGNLGTWRIPYPSFGHVHS